MQFQEMSLRGKCSHMPCNLVNFISVSQDSEVEEKKCGGGGISYHHHRFDDAQRCPVGSISEQAWRPAARWGGAEQEKERAPRSTCCPFIGAFAHAQSVSTYVQFVPCVLPA